MNNSNLPQVQGSYFIQIHKWLVDEIGYQAAVVIGYLDLVSRNQPGKNPTFKTRQEIITAVEGYVGRDLVDEKLKELESMRWVVKRVKPLNNNSARRFTFALNPVSIHDYVNTGVRYPGASTADSAPQDDEQDEGQYGGQDNSIRGKEEEQNEEEHPPPPSQLARSGGGGDQLMFSKNAVSEVDSALRISRDAILEEEPAVTELDDFLKSQSFNPHTAHRIKRMFLQLIPNVQCQLLRVARMKVPKARESKEGYMITLTQNALDGILTCSDIALEQINLNSSCAGILLKESEIIAEIKGKEAVLRDGALIAVVKNDGLYVSHEMPGRRFSLSDASKIILGVRSGKYMLT